MSGKWEANVDTKVSQLKYWCVVAAVVWRAGEGNVVLGALIALDFPI